MEKKKGYRTQLTSELGWLDSGDDCICPSIHIKVPELTACFFFFDKVTGCLSCVELILEF